jgi:hypothetical protein
VGTFAARRGNCSRINCMQRGSSPLPSSRISLFLSKISLLSHVISSRVTIRTCVRTIEDSSIKCVAMAAATSPAWFLLHRFCPGAKGLLQSLTHWRESVVQEGLIGSWQAISKCSFP